MLLGLSAGLIDACDLLTSRVWYRRAVSEGLLACEILSLQLLNKFTLDEKAYIQDLGDLSSPPHQYQGDLGFAKAFQSS